jgi:glycosyltransferase involved in cell wall biosynthesis
MKALPKRTVLLITPYFPPEGGGLERYAMHIAQRLQSEHSWRVVMVTASPEKSPHDSEYTESGIKVYHLSYRFRLSNTPFDFGWRRKLRRIIASERPDLINAHMPVPGLADVAASVAGRIPFVLTYHAGSMKKGHLLPDLAVGLYERLQLPRLLRRADSVICSSDYVREQFLADWKHKSITITPGADETIFKPARVSKTAGSTLLFIGKFGPSYRHKGLGDAISAVAKLKPSHPQIQLLVIGDGDVDYYLSMARALGVESNLDFKGTLDQKQIAALCHTADLLVHPSTNDSFPMVIVEAMAAGLPVVSTRVGGIPTLIQEGKTGLLVPAGRPTALANAVDQILSDRGYAATLGRAGRKLVMAGLTWSQKTARTNELFERALLPHICQVTAYYPPHIGGVEKVVQELSRMLTVNGYSVDVLTSNSGARRAPDHTPAAEPEGLGVQSLQSFEILHTPVMRGLFTRLLRQPHRTVVHLHIAQALVPEVTWLAAKLRRLPLVSHFHLDVEPSSPLGELIFRPYKRIFLRFVLRHSDRVIFLTSEQRTAMTKKYGLDPARTFVMPNGVSDEYFLPERKDFHSPLRLLFVGRLAVQKRPERIIAAMAELPNAHLDVVGEGEDRRRLSHLVAVKKLKNVTFQGAKFGDELRAIYRDSDVFVLPSDREGMPLVLLEAMAASLPVVGSDVPGIRELVKGTGLLVEDPDPENFARALAPLATQPQKLAGLSAASRAAAEEYSWTHLTLGLQALYSELATW